MKRILLSACTLSLLVGCGRGLPSETPSKVARSHDRLDVVLPEAHHEPEISMAVMQEPGDFVVYRFSGSYRDTPVTMTQRVVARDRHEVVVDVTIDSNGEVQRLRMRIDNSSKGRGELISVARLEGQVQRPFGIAAYEKLMGEIVLSADENEGLIGSRDVLVDIGGSELAATKTSYRVRVGAHEAVMHTVSSNAFGWGDLGGEIATPDGKVLYKAELLDVGGPNHDPSMATGIQDDGVDEVEQLVE
jgi:hypothetical protein